MEKEFKIKCFRKSGIVQGSLFTIISMVIVSFIYGHTSHVALIVCGLMIIISILFLFPREYFYVILKEDKLILQNRIWSFWRKEFFYTQIDSIHFVEIFFIFLNRPYIDIRTNSSGKSAYKCILGFVERSSYKELVDILRDKGVKVVLIALAYC